MGYGKVWTEEKVGKEILKVMDSLGIKRMPSRSEIENVTGNSRLTNKISKNGGYYAWAEKLGLSVKQSDTYLGIKHEKMIAEKITEITGFYTELTSVKFPYDILVGGCVKIDVKFSNGYNNVNGFSYSFNLEHDMQRCDLYVFVCGDEKILIIPSHVLLGKKQFSVGVNSAYDKYKDYWEPIYNIHECLFNQEIFEKDLCDDGDAYMIPF